jgi:nucleotide sugar dehydrogenase
MTQRVDPGRTFPAFEDIPKIVSGLDAASLDSISQLYGRVFKTLLPVSTPEVAEMTKLYENCQRMVCAAYANEMADACNALGIDAWEVSEAAASKPFGYVPFRPGPGIGGHCIPVNPYYLLSTCSMPILEHATTTSWQRPAEIAKRFMQTLLRENYHTSTTTTAKTERPRVLVVGVGFKRGQSVMSNSPGAGIIRSLLCGWDMYVEFADPLVPAEGLSYAPKMDTVADWNKQYLSTFDGIIVAINQVGLDLSLLEQLPGVTVHDYSGSLRGSFSVDSAETEEKPNLTKGY